MGITAAFMVPHPPLIVPDIGKGDESDIQATVDSYHEAARKIGEAKPETIVLISPHATAYADYFHISPGKTAEGSFSQFGAGHIIQKVSYDSELVNELCTLTQNREFPAGTLGEQNKLLDHGTMVPLHFVNQYYTDYKLVRIGLSGLSPARHYEMGMYISEAADNLGRRTVLIASGDLSHRLKPDGPYGYIKEGPEYDSQIMDVMGAGDFGRLFTFPEEFCDKAGECGHRSFTIMAGALDGKDVLSERKSYEGPFGVGYGICAYDVKENNPGRRFLKIYEDKRKQEIAELRNNEDAYVRLARQTIEEYTCNGTKPSVPDNLPKEMYGKRAGVFVSIKEDGLLRGCIGTIQAVQKSIACEIIENAVSAASKDPRFSPIMPDELDRLTISVDVLGDTEPVNSMSELDVMRYGVIVSKGHRRGLLLPNLEGVDTVKQQIEIAKQKAGIAPDEDVTLERFEVIRHY